MKFGFCMLWDGIPRQEVLDLQKSLNKNGIADKDGNPLLEDGKYSKKFYDAVNNAFKTLDGKFDTAIKRGDTPKYTKGEMITLAADAYGRLLKEYGPKKVKGIKEKDSTKPDKISASSFDPAKIVKLPYKPEKPNESLLEIWGKGEEKKGTTPAKPVPLPYRPNEPEEMTPEGKRARLAEALRKHHPKYKIPEETQPTPDASDKPENSPENITLVDILNGKGNSLSVNSGIDNIAYYNNSVKAKNGVSDIVSGIVGKEDKLPRKHDFGGIPELIKTKPNNWEMLNFDEVPDISQSEYDTYSAYRSLNQFCWENEFNTDDIINIQRVLNCNKGTNLDVNGDIDENTAYKICEFAKLNKISLADACNELKKCGNTYNQIYSSLELKDGDIGKIQDSLKELNYKNINGLDIGQDDLIGFNTLYAINDYAETNGIDLATAVIDLRDGNYSQKTSNSLEGMILRQGEKYAGDKNSFFNYDKVSELFSQAGNVDFDHENITKVYMLNNEKGAPVPFINKSMGHNSIMLVDKNGNSAFFSYYSNDSGAILNNLTGESNGEMRFKTLNADDTKAFFENMSINNAISSDGALENETYTRFARYDVTSEQGTAMLNSAIDFFVNPGKYGLLENDKDDGKDGTWQCDAVTRHILEIGGIVTKGRIWPNGSFNATGNYYENNK